MWGMSGWMAGQGFESLVALVSHRRNLIQESDTQEQISNAFYLGLDIGQNPDSVSK